MYDRLKSAWRWLTVVLVVAIVAVTVVGVAAQLVAPAGSPSNPPTSASTATLVPSESIGPLGSSPYVVGTVTAGPVSPSPQPPRSTATATPTLAPIQTPRPTAAPTARPSPPPPAGFAIIAAGDTRSDLAGIQATTALIVARPGVPVLDVGDDTEDGSAALYQSFFNPNWGKFKNRIHPTPGNHEYDTAGAAPYFAYYGAAAGSPARSWYSFDLPNNWHVIELNGNISHGAGSPQERFLASDLAANAGKHIIAFWHEPRFSSGSEHGSDSSFTPFWNDLYAAHADLVFNGHDHDYERFALQNPSGKVDLNGIREFVVGMGGAPLYRFGSIAANSQVRNNTTWGILVLSLNAHSYSWRFVPQAGKTFTDSGTQATHT
jgi:hypothetical protein